MTKLRIGFAGTPVFAATHLQSLLASGNSVVCVYTQPDRPSGRGKKLKPSPVKQLALDNSVPVYQPISLKTGEAQEVFRSLHLDLLIVVAYGLILPREILESPKLGCINVHASLLPRWRGAAPIERAILAGDKETGVTIMQMDEGLDTGDMLDTERVSIDAADDRADVEEKLARAGTTALVRVIDGLTNYQQHATPQDDTNSSYAAKLNKSEALIDWGSPAPIIDRQVRVGIGRTPAFTFIDGQRLRIISATVLEEQSQASPGAIVSVSKAGIEVACGNSVLRIDKVQLPGKTVSSVRDVLNSRADFFNTNKTFSSDAPIEL